MPAGVDVIVAAHSHDFISGRVRSRAKYGAIGYHPSLLPRHRGRDAIEWALRFGDPISGGTVYWLGETMDGGPIAAQDWCWVRRGDTAAALCAMASWSAWEALRAQQGLSVADARRVLAHMLRAQLSCC